MSPPASSITSLQAISMVYHQFQKAWSTALWPIFLEKMSSMTQFDTGQRRHCSSRHSMTTHMLNLNKTERCGYQGKGLHRLWKEKESAWARADTDEAADSEVSTHEQESMWDIRGCWCTASLTLSGSVEDLSLIMKGHIGDPVLTLEAQLQSEDKEFIHIKPPEKKFVLEWGWSFKS